MRGVVWLVDCLPRAKRLLSRCWTLAGLISGLSLHQVQAGGGPLDYLIVYDPSDANSVAIANCYQQLRDIPDCNMVPYVFPSISPQVSSCYIKSYTLSPFTLLGTLREVMSRQQLTNQIDGIFFAGATPSSYYNAAGKTLSFPGLLYDSPNWVTSSDMPTAWGDRFNELDRVASEPTTEIRGDVSYSGKKHVMTGTVGYSGAYGNNAAEVIAALKRSRTADGTKPDLTIYWPTNSDIRSTTRAVEISGVTNEWKELGMNYCIFPGIVPANKTGLPGSSPATNRCPMGAIVGSTKVYPSGSTYWPGSFAEHLTSWGAQFGSDQSSIREWVRMGVAGTGGTVTEPFAIAGKFPHARLHSHYRRGASLAEAFYQSIGYYLEYFLVADPLCQPYADIPSVAIISPEAGATVSGTTTITYTASSPVGLESNLDMAVDGRIVRIGDGTETVQVTRVTGGFTVNTTTLSDGYHDLRVIAYNTNAIRTQGYARKGLVVNNAGMRLDLTGPTEVDRRSNGIFQVTLQGLSGATNLGLYAGGRCLTNGPAQDGAWTVPGNSLAYYGSNVIQAVADLSNGQKVRSAPWLVNPTWTPLAATIRVALNTNALAYVKTYTNACSPSFSWTNVPAYTSYLTNEMFSLTQYTDFPYMVGPDTNYAHEFLMYVTVPSNSVYDFQCVGYAYMSFFLDGQKAFTNVMTGGGMVTFTEKLAAGLHELKVRTTQRSSGGNTACVYVRGDGFQIERNNGQGDILSKLSRTANWYVDGANTYAPDMDTPAIRGTVFHLE